VTSSIYDGTGEIDIMFLPLDILALQKYKAEMKEIKNVKIIRK
jgi:hypothetical protein